MNAATITEKRTEVQELERDVQRVEAHAETARRSLQDAEARYARGEHDAGDLASARATLEARESALGEARAALEDARGELADHLAAADDDELLDTIRQASERVTELRADADAEVQRAEETLTRAAERVLALQHEAGALLSVANRHAATLAAKHETAPKAQRERAVAGTSLPARPPAPCWPTDRRAHPELARMKPQALADRAPRTGRDAA